MAAWISPIVPVTVIEEESFAPEVKERPLVDPSAKVPLLTERVSVSASVPAIWSVSVIALAPENVREVFSLVVADAGPEAVGDQLIVEFARSGTSWLAIGVPMPETRS